VKCHRTQRRLLDVGHKPIEAIQGQSAAICQTLDPNGFTLETEKSSYGTLPDCTWLGVNEEKLAIIPRHEDLVVLYWNIRPDRDLTALSRHFL